MEAKANDDATTALTAAAGVADPNVADQWMTTSNNPPLTFFQSKISPTCGHGRSVMDSRKLQNYRNTNPEGWDEEREHTFRSSVENEAGNGVSLQQSIAVNISYYSTLIVFSLVII
eukprot:COSAG05_NODE_596_length_8452_cov_10.143302_3_plen_116_part_00